MKGWEYPVLACIVGAAAVGGCSKSDGPGGDAALTAVAVTAIEKTIQKPDTAQCEIKIASGMTSRNVAESPFGPRLDSLCRKEDASQAAQGCWSALKDHKVGFLMSKRFPECLTMMDARISHADVEPSGLRFPCGRLSKVAVKKLEKLESGRVRVTYVVNAKKDEPKVNAIERACGEVSVVPSEERTVLLLQDGVRWTLAGQ